MLELFAQNSGLACIFFVAIISGAFYLGYKYSEDFHRVYPPINIPKKTPENKLPAYRRNCTTN